MIGNKIFNYFASDSKLKTLSIVKDVESFNIDSLLVDDVDTTITSFLKTYGAPPHYDPDDFEDGDDKDFDDIDDVVEDDVTLEKPVESPAVSSPVEPSEPVDSAPVEPDQSVKDE